MSETEQKNQVKSSELAEADSFDSAIASRNAIIEKKDRVIKELQDKLGKREEYISQQMEKLDEEKTLRIEAEKIVSQGKKLEKPNNKNYVPKSKAEQFADKYREACERLRNK